MKRIVANTCVLAVCAGTAACGARTADEPAPSETEAAEEARPMSAAEPIRAAVGEEFTLRLNANLTTGYQWRLAAPLDSSIVVLVGSRYVATPHPPGVVGSGGVDHWTFRAVGRGTTTLVLGHFPPGRIEPVQTQRFAIEVR